MKIRTMLKSQQLHVFLLLPPFLILLAKLMTPDNMAWFNISPHPYLFIAITLSAYYGLQFALFFSFTVSIQYMSLLHLQTDYQEIETLITLEYLSLPLTMIILSSLVGEFRTRSQNRLSQLESKDNENNKVTNSMLNKINMLNKESFELKKQLITKLDTASSIFNMVSKLNTVDINDIINAYTQILRSSLHVEGAIIYKLDPVRKAFISVATIDDETTNGKIPDIQLDKIKDPVIDEAYQSKKLITIDHIYNEKELLSDNQTIMATPILILDEVFGLVRITQMPFLQYTPENFKLVDLFTKWMSQNLTHALEYQNVTKQSIMNTNLNIFTHNYYAQRLQEEYEQAVRFKNHFTLIRCNLKNIPTNDIKLSHIRKVISQIIRKFSRVMDCVCEGDSNSSFDIILVHTDEEGAKAYISNIKNHISQLSKSDNLKESLSMDYYYSYFDSLITLNELKENYREA